MTNQKSLTLSHGSLRFSAMECGDGPIVILLHGFPDTLRSWDAQLAFLADHGYRAIAVALRGYEPQSQPPDGDYSSPSLVSDVVAWIEQLGGGPVHLIGHDWGASIAYGVAMAVPNQIKSLSVLAVPHAGRFLSEIHYYPKQLRLSWYMLFFQLPRIADYVVRRNNFSFLRRLWRDWSPGWAFSEQQFAQVMEAFSRPQVVESALAYYRAAIGLHSLPLGGSSREQAPWSVNVPTLGITGADEGCIAADVFTSMMREEDFPEGLKVVTVADAGHFPHREQPALVNALLLEWLAAHESGESL